MSLNFLANLRTEAFWHSSQEIPSIWSRLRGGQLSLGARLFETGLDRG